MQEKKKERVNLESKKSLFFSIGLTLSLISILGIFLQGKPIVPVQDLGELDRGVEPVEEVMITYQNEKTLPPPPPIMIFETFSIEPDDVEISDDEMFDVHDDNSFVEAIPTISDESEAEPDFVVFADQMPEFPGGQKALQQWIVRHVDYPQIARENGIHGRVYVQFVVNILGEVTRVQVARGVDESLDSEAIRVVKKLPKFKPGVQNGRTVNVAYTVPINFQLQ